jgi:hypothetical protein
MCLESRPEIIVVRQPKEKRISTAAEDRGEEATSLLDASL